MPGRYSRRDRPIQDVIVEIGRLCRWLDTQLSLECAAADLVLPERAATLPGICEQQHHLAVPILMPGIQIKQPRRAGHGLGVPPARGVVGCQRIERL